MTSTNSSSPAILRRLVSMMYDALLLLGVLAVFLLLPYTLIGAYTQFVASPRLLWWHFFVVLLAYFGWFWTHGGQTLAMKTWGLRLSGINGQALTPGQALFRYLLAWPSLCLFGIGIWWALFDSDRQFLHDRLAGTRISKI